MIITLLNYMHGRGNSANCIATAVNFSINYKSNCIIIDSDYEKSLLSNAFFSNSDVNSLKNLDYGIDSIANLIYSKHRIDKEDFDNYTKSIIGGRLSFLPGSSKVSRKLYNELLIKTMPKILDNAKDCFDMVFIDVNSGVENTLSKKIISVSDLIIVTLEQNEKVLNDFFKNGTEQLKGKDYVIMLGKYDENCKCSAKYISKTFKFKGDIFTVPYNTHFLDAINNSNVYEYFYKNNLSIRKIEDIEFFNDLKAISNRLFELSKNKNIDYMPLGDRNIISIIKDFIEGSEKASV